jgi:hypothetical protein
MQWKRCATALVSVVAACRLADLVKNPDTGAPPAGVTHFDFAVQPTTTEQNVVITPAVQVVARDSAGHTVTAFDGMVSIAIDANPTGGRLAGTLSVAAVDGVADFGDLRIDQAGSGYTLSATTSGLDPSTSASFDIMAPVSATHLTFITQPTDTRAGDPIAPAVQVAAQDNSGNTVTGFTGSITVAIKNNPTGGVLSGTTTVDAVNGVASFADLAIDKAGSGYSLAAVSASLSGGSSSSFDVTVPPPPPTQLAFTVQPSSVQTGQSISPPVKVTALNDAGDPVTTFTGQITVALTNNPLGATLSGTLTVRAVNGVATFSDLHIDLPGVDYKLTAAFAGQSPIATSAPFSVLSP